MNGVGQIVIGMRGMRPPIAGVESGSARISQTLRPSSTRAVFDEMAGHRLMAVMERGHQLWFDQLQRVDGVFGDLNDLVLLAQAAPNAFLSGHLQGILGVRVIADYRLMSVPFALTADSLDILSNNNELMRHEREFPQWYARLDLADGLYAEADDLRVLLIDAPNDFVRGFIHGALTFRQVADWRLDLAYGHNAPASAGVRQGAWLPASHLS